MSTEKATEVPLLSVKATEKSTARTTDAGESSMEIVKVYGASDDLIEVEGPPAVSDEFSGGDAQKFVGFSDGTVLSIVYAEDGCWRISRVVEGTAEYTIKPAVGQDDDEYSDVATLTGGPFTRVKVAASLPAACIGQHAKDPRYAPLMAFAAWMNANYDEVEAPAVTDLVDEYIAEGATNLASVVEREVAVD